MKAQQNAGDETFTTDGSWSSDECTTVGVTSVQVK